MAAMNASIRLVISMALTLYSLRAAANPRIPAVWPFNTVCCSRGVHTSFSLWWHLTCCIMPIMVFIYL